MIGCALDVDLIDFLRSASESLSPTGVIVIKDNVCQEDQAYFYDKADNSIARGDNYLHHVFGLAGLHVVLAVIPDGWNADLLPIRMLALRKK